MIRPTPECYQSIIRGTCSGHDRTCAKSATCMPVANSKSGHVAASAARRREKSLKRDATMNIHQLIHIHHQRDRWSVITTPVTDNSASTLSADNVARQKSEKIVSNRTE